jgi:tetratricopeptide (TPR) repeat protein
MIFRLEVCHMMFSQRLVQIAKAGSIVLTLLFTMFVVMPSSAIASGHGEGHKRVPNFEYPYPISQRRIEAEQLLNQGLSKAYQLDLQGAIADLIEATKTDPTDEDVFRYLGDVYVEAGNFTEAIAAYSSALRYRPGFSHLYNSRGEAHLALKEYDLAIRDFTRAISVYPGEPRGHYNRSVAYRNIQSYVLALNDLQNAIRTSNHTYVDAFIDRSKIRQILGDVKGAIEDYQTASLLLESQPEEFLNQEDFANYQKLQVEYKNTIQAAEDIKTKLLSNCDEQPSFIVDQNQFS